MSSTTVPVRSSGCSDTLQGDLQGPAHRLRSEIANALPSMFLRRPSDKSGSRGQGLVEFALILPILTLLMVMALDFGRVFFGWVALNNAARIGADFAAGHADAWDGVPDTEQAEEQARYQELILNDLQALNCTLPAPDPVEDPVFSGFEDGDPVEVTLKCEFGLMTPLAEGIFGGPVPLTAQSDFFVYRTMNANLPPPPPTPTPTPTPAPSPTATPAPCAAPIAAFEGRVGTLPPPPSGKSALVVSFTDQSTAGAACPIDSWLWEFGDGTTSVDQNPLKTYIHLGPQPEKKFTVKLTVSSGTSGQSDVESKNNYVTVTRL